MVVKLFTVLATCAMGCLSLGVPWAEETAQGPALGEASPKLLPDGWPVPQDLYGDRGRSYVIYVEKMPGADLNAKIQSVVQRALGGGVAAEVVLPPGHHTLTKPIKLRRQRKTATDDTRAEAVELADIRNVFTSVKGGKVQDLPRGTVLRGSTPGATRLIREGGPNQVVAGALHSQLRSGRPGGCHIGRSGEACALSWGSRALTHRDRVCDYRDLVR